MSVRSFGPGPVTPESHAFFLSDDSGPDGMEDGEPAARLHISFGGNGDYYVQVGDQERLTFVPTVRFRTSGSSDDNVATFVAALFRYLRGDYEAAASIATAAAELAMMRAKTPAWNRLDEDE